MSGISGGGAFAQAPVTMRGNRNRNFICITSRLCHCASDRRAQAFGRKIDEIFEEPIRVRHRVHERHVLVLTEREGMSHSTHDKMHSQPEHIRWQVRQGSSERGDEAGGHFLNLPDEARADLFARIRVRAPDESHELQPAAPGLPESIEHGSEERPQDLSQVGGLRSRLVLEGGEAFETFPVHRIESTLKDRGQQGRVSSRNGN